MGIDYAALDGIIKRNYDKNFIQTQINEEMFLFDKIGPADVKPTGEGFFFAGRFARNQGGGAQNESEALKQAGAPKVKQAKVLPKVVTWTGQLTGLAQAMAKGEPGSFVDVMDDAFTDALTAARMDIDRQFWGYGSGKVGTVSTGATSATQAVDNVAWFHPGAIYDRYNSSNVYQATHTCQDVNIFTGQVIFDASFTSTTSDYFVKQGVKIEAPTDGKEIMGLRGIMDDGTLVDTFQGLNRATGTYYILWRGLVVAAGSVDVTSDLLQRCWDRVSIMGAKEPIIISNYGQRRKYLALVQPQRRFMEGKFDAGYSVLEWNGKPWAVTYRAPKNAVYMPNLDIIKRFDVHPLALDDTGGTVKPLTGYDVAYFYYKYYGNLGTKQPNAAGLILEGLNEPASY